MYVYIFSTAECTITTQSNIYLSLDKEWHKFILILRVSRSCDLESRIKKMFFSTKDHKGVKLSIKINLRYSLFKLSPCFSIFKELIKVKKLKAIYYLTFRHVPSWKTFSSSGPILESKDMRANFQKMGKKGQINTKKGQNILKFSQKWTTFENILEKGMWLRATILQLTNISNH